MTRQKSFKSQVRGRMAKTGEKYTAARARLLQRTDGYGSAPGTEPDMPVADDALRGATGRGWDEWLSMLDDWGATERNHTDTARWLVEDQGIGSWWAQSVTVGYERARGLRAKHQMATGFSVGATRTVNASPDRASDAFTDVQLRQRWLGDVELAQRTVRRGKSARFEWPGDGSRVVVAFEPRGTDRTVVAVQHERLPDPDTAERMKLYWRERLTILKDQLATDPE